MEKLQKIKIDGKDIDEGYVLVHWLDNRFKSNKNALVATLGGTGTGKSYFNMRAMELWYQYKFGERFPQENICFSIPEAVRRIRNGKLRKGEVIIVEEAGVLMNSLDFQNKISKFFGSVLQSFRSKNIGILFNLPNISFLNKTARSLLHLVFQTTGINNATRETSVKCFYWQTNPLSGKIYQKYLLQKFGHNYIKIKKMNFKHPQDEELVAEYEKRKDIFVNKTMDELDKIDSDGNEKKTEVNNKNFNAMWVVIKDMHEKGKSGVEISKFLGTSQQKIAHEMKLINFGLS